MFGVYCNRRSLIGRIVAADGGIDCAMAITRPHRIEYLLTAAFVDIDPARRGKMRLCVISRERLSAALPASAIFGLKQRSGQQLSSPTPISPASPAARFIARA